MAFTYNSSGTVGGSSSANPIQFNHTAGANSKLVVLTLAALGGGITDVTGGVAPTYNGNNMTQCGATQTSAEGATAMWYYLSPDAGQTRQISITNGSAYTIRYSCSDYENTSYSAQFTNSGGASNGEAADVPASVTGVLDGSVCVSVMVHGEKDQFASITGGTSFFGTASVDEGSLQSGAAYSIKSGAGTETHTYVSGGTSDDYNWVMGAWEESSAPVIEALAGTINVGVSVTGDIDRSRNIAGETDVGVSVTGGIRIIKNVTGQVNAAVSMTGTLGRVVGIAGQVNVGVSVTGDIGVVTDIAGTVNVGVSVTGTLSGTIGLLGQVNAGVTVTGTLSRTVELAGQVDVGVSVTGDMDKGAPVGETEYLAGQTDVGVTVTGDIDVSRQIAGQVDVGTSLSGTLSRTVEMSGQIDVGVSVSGDITITTAIAGQVTVGVTVSGQTSYLVSSLSDDTEDKILDHLTGKASYTMPKAYIGLSTTNPKDDASGLDEPIIGVGGYHRIPTSDADWAGAVAGVASNQRALSFSFSSAAWSTGSEPLRYAAIFDAASAGNMLGYATLATPRTVNGSDIILQFAESALDVQIT